MEGPNVEALIELTGYPGEFVTNVAMRAKAAGLWLEGDVDYSHWFEGDIVVNPVRFWMDVFVAEGLLISHRRDDGTFVYFAGERCN
jgi:hypothetical protein